LDAIARLTASLADRYRLERELGAGGMATVYVARDLRHDRQVAIKVMRAEVGGELGADRFLREIRTTANLQHPHIVPVFDSGAVEVFDGESTTTRLYFVMPLIEGETLRQRLDRTGPLPVDDAVRIVRDLASALEVAHARGILHRDLKPENILLSHGHALLADFGVARATEGAGHERLTQTGLAIGTPAYMSPEQASGERELGPSSDVYALASILYELLTGEMPFTGATVQAILVKRFTQEAPRARTRRGDTPMACDAAIARALAREPRERYSTAAAFAEALVDKAVAAPRTGERSIAVLPFANLSTDAENGYFSDGLTEEVITTLSKVGTLRVMSRGTMMKFRDRSRGAADVARELGVTHALEGSVRKSGNRLRITAALVAADSDVSLWTERFDGVLDDVFDMQDRVAAAVVQALDLVLTPEESRRLTERPLNNAEAYDRYLRARQAVNEFSLSGVEQAFGYLEDALALAPDSVLLLRGLGIACFSAANTSARPDRAALLARALGYADAIEQRQPASPYAAEIRGMVATLTGDQVEALLQLGRAFEQLPADPDLAYWYAASLAEGGHHAAAIAISREIARVAPDHAMGWMPGVLSLTYSGRYAEALARLGALPKTAPPNFVQLFYGLVYLTSGEPQRALASLDPGGAPEPDAISLLTRFVGHAVRRDSAAAGHALLPDLADHAWKDYQITWIISTGFILLGDVEEAARWLAQAVHLGSGIHEAITRHNAVWRPWLDHPRIAPILEAMQEVAHRHAQLPVAPRALALVEREKMAALN
jgi:serine/threonine-protein kinase